MDTLLPGISAERVPTSRLTVNVLSAPGRTGPPVLFVHGNVSSSLSRPPQPILAQTRAVLDGYAAAGGRYREVAIHDAAHGPHLDQPERLVAELGAHLSSA